MTTTETILNQLNDWDSLTDDDDLADLRACLAEAPMDSPPKNDIWPDVIHTLDSYDAKATASLPSGGLSLFALTNGTVIRWDAEDICWRVQS